jgi:hypothetical protein
LSRGKRNLAEKILSAQVCGNVKQITATRCALLLSVNLFLVFWFYSSELEQQGALAILGAWLNRPI